MCFLLLSFDNSHVLASQGGPDSDSARLMFIMHLHEHHESPFELDALIERSSSSPKRIVQVPNDFPLQWAQ